MRIDVVGSEIEAALKTLKEQMLKEGLFQEMKPGPVLVTNLIHPTKAGSPD